MTDLDGMLARLCGPDRKIIRLRDKRGIYLFLIEITAITKYLADADGRGIAAKCRLPYSQRKLLDLARRYDARADRLSRRASVPMRGEKV